MKKATLFLILPYFLIGCGVSKTMQATQDMKKSTENLERDSNHLAKRTDDLEYKFTFKDSYLMLMTNLKWLWGEDGKPAMEGGSREGSEPNLLVYAGAAVQSMWFNYWNGDYNDASLASLDDRYQRELEVMLALTMGHSPFKASVNVLNPDRDYKAAASLGAKLDHVPQRYLETLQKRNLPSLTPYDVLVLALKNRNSAERKEILPRTVAKVLQFRDQAIYLLQLRHNYLPMMVMASVTPFKDLSMAGQALGLVLNQNVDLKVYDREQIKEWLRWLKMAQQTRADLKAAGIELEYNSTFRKVLGNLRFASEPSSVQVESGSDAELRQQMVAAFMELQR